MASTPESSRTKAGPSSSPPSGGTAPTVYSPDLTRSLSKRQGKQPEAAPTTSFLNEIRPDQEGYISRHLIIDSYPMDVAPESRLLSIEHQMKHYVCFIHCVPLVVREVIRLRFDDINDACEAQLILTQLDFLVRFITHHEFASTKFQDLTPAMESEGQIAVTVQVKPLRVLDERSMLEMAASYARSMATPYGNIREQALHRVSAGIDDQGATDVKFRIEMYSVDAANRAVQQATVMPVANKFNSMTVQSIKVRPWIQASSVPSSADSTPPLDRYGRLTGYRLQQQPAISRHPDDAVNRVQKERILNGSDVRTTVMLRNIPNKLDKLELKALLDKFCFGRYDFVYLRIDFSSAANVGYAFINVTDMTGLLAIVTRLDGFMWDGYRTAKAAEISYATIQGREALEQKFKNSSVMKEAPFCRPGVYVSFEHAQQKQSQAAFTKVGTETPFPPPDNPAKLQRSMESARQVGLYPPHGSNITIDHRSRSSIWDRGTPQDLSVSVVPAANGVPDMMKRCVECWFVHQTGQPTPFHAIPMAAVRDFIQRHPWLIAAMSPPGAIGQRALMPPPNFNGGHFPYNG